MKESVRAAQKHFVSEGADKPAKGMISGEVEVSVVMPCLDEADTLATCIQTAQRALSENGLSGGGDRGR